MRQIARMVTGGCGSRWTVLVMFKGNNKKAVTFSPDKFCSNTHKCRRGNKTTVLN